jgi:cation:H+ antiporter
MIILIGGAEALVRGASSLARRFHVSELAIGLTIVAFGTSTPELIVNIFAGIAGNSDIAFGNVIGSNIFNILLILGVSGLIRPLAAQHSTTWKEIPFSLLAALALWMLVKDVSLFGHEANALTRFDSGVLLAFFLGFLLYVWKSMKQEPGDETTEEHTLPLPISLGATAIGLLALFGGGRLVVSHAIELAQLLGVSDKLIALTIVAGGTSLPELATSAVAAYRNKPDIAIGNIVGSNIFNFFFILGVSGTITPLAYPSSFDFDMIVLVAATLALFLFMFTGKRHKLDRWEAGLFLCCYVAYTAWLLRGGN